MIAVAVLTLLAGCSGPVSDSAGTPTASPPADPTATDARATTGGGTTAAGGATTAAATTDGGTDTTTTTDDATTGEGTRTTTSDDREPWPDDDGPPRVETLSGDRPDLNYSATLVLRRVERLRGLDATDDVRLAVEKPPWGITSNRTRDYPDERYGIAPIGAVALQLESDAETPILRSSGVAKSVNPRVTETVNVWEADAVREYRNDSQQVVLAHEFTHVLQYQNDVAWEALSDFPTTDEVLALKALIEGDAIVVHEQYRERYVDREGGVTPESYNDTVTRASWPIDLVNLAYYHGYRFFDRTTDSPEARTEVLEDPPRTTAALLHPESAPERPAGSATPPGANGWTQYRIDRVGELTVRTAFRANGIPVERSRAAAGGWRNDRMVYLRNQSDEDRQVVHWRTRWADEAEAREFARTWRAMLNRSNATTEDGLIRVPRTPDRPGNWVWIDRVDDRVDVVTATSREDLLAVLAEYGVEDPAEDSVR